jgi:RNA binding exosome subunit
MRTKSAKDIAFDKERGKYRGQIRLLECQLKAKDKELKDAKDHSEELEENVRQMQDWNLRLLEYMDMSEEDLKMIIKKDKQCAGIVDNLNSLLNSVNYFGI